MCNWNRRVVGALVSSAQRNLQALGTSASAMGFVNQAVAENEFFYSVVFFLWACVIAELFLFSRTLPRVAGFEGRRVPLSMAAQCFLFWSVSSSFFRESLLSPSGNLLSAGALAKSHASTMTYSGQEEERAPSIYRAGSCRPEALTRVRRSKVSSLTLVKPFSLVAQKPSLHWADVYFTH